ncbi:hypothetical protein OKW30_001184 [Paraburkholderia sp. Clong3]|uniref:hypothetical protein n=1 Tax=Paraburkholderia sp. Clong3 TaxID=2991061 RepID=UPI003D1AA6DB
MEMLDYPVLDNLDARLTEMHNDIKLLEQEGYPTARLKRSLASLRRQLVASTAIRRVRIEMVPRPESINR